MNKYSYLEKDEKLETQVLSVSGRVFSIRSAGSGLVFYDIKQGGEKLQVLMDRRSFLKKFWGFFFLTTVQLDFMKMKKDLKKLKKLFIEEMLLELWDFLVCFYLDNDQKRKKKLKYQTNFNSSC